MFDRPAFKAAGKANFERNYWACVAVSVILVIAMSFGTGSSGAASTYNVIMRSGGNIKGYVDDYDDYDDWDGYDYSYGYGNDYGYGSGGYGDYGAAVLGPMMAVLMGFAAVAGAVGVAVRVCAANPYQVGTCRFFMENRDRADAKFALVGRGFAKNYGNVVLTQFLKDLYTILWLLLFIVPGIIKSYAYFCVPYILAENPDLDHKRVIELSQEMTHGYKGRIFVTDLSFILWFLLNALTLGILGIFFLNPYVFGTRAEIYDFLRRNALENGIATTVELPGFGDTAPKQISEGGWYN